MRNFGHHLPFPLVEDIMLRLPVESLVRFRCVCKSWSSLFQSSTFISRHLSNSMKRLGSSHNLLLRLWLTRYNHQLFSLSSEKEGGFSLMHIPIVMANVNFVIARDVALCNPATREVRFLPPSDLTTKIKDGMVLGVGMGNDSKCNGCMIIVRMWISYVECRCKKFIVEEYALCSDSWRTIESANPWRAEFDTSCFAMHFKGAHYWWAKLRDSTTTVLALNVGGGDFRNVPLPSPIDISSTIGRYLGVLNDSISLRPRRWFTSGGVGATRFGLPVAIGAVVANPGCVVVDIDGDGSFIMSVQELATIKVENLHVKILLLNNQHLGMVVQWEDHFYKSNRAHTYLGDPSNENEIFPNMLMFADACGIPAARVSKKEDLRAAIQKMLDTPGPYILDVIVPHQEHVLPMIPTNGTFEDVITEGDGKTRY
ncbi:TPP-binding enzyme, conserved site [Sesbania bispinosa]|nr:TPP-binding enzyme, conserved site [Sesbania bispinosa]